MVRSLDRFKTKMLGELVSKRRFIALSACLSMGLVSALFTGATANAAEPNFDPLRVVQEQALLGGPSTHPDIASTASGTGVEHASDALQSIAPVSVSPVLQNADSRTAPAGVSVVVSDTSSFGFVTGLNAQGNNASFVVINDASAPSDFDFAIGTADENLHLAPSSNGTIAVTDTNGAFVNLILPPWAVDANGATLPTSYTIQGNTVRQHVDTTGAVFPVVADPSTGCGIGWCSLYFNKSETHDIATAGFIGLGGAVAACGPAGPWAVAICTIGAASIGVAATLADNHNQCVGIFFAHIAAEWNPFTYTGAQCN